MTTTNDIMRAIDGSAFNYQDEYDLQEGIEQVLSAAGIGFEREYPLGGSHHDRADFFVPDGRVVVEVKIKGSFAEVLRQLQRYASHIDVSEVLLVTTRSNHVNGMPETLAGKPVHVLFLRGNGL